MESSKIEERKDACPIEKLPIYAFLKTPIKDDSNTFFSFNQLGKIGNLSVLNIKQADEFATAQVSYTGANNQQFNVIWIFRRLNGKWKLDPMGLKTVKPLKAATSDETQLEVAANIGYTYKNDIILAFDVRSKTAANYLARYQSVLITDSGEFPLHNTETYGVDPNVFWEITSAQPVRFIIPFKGATGKPKAIRFLSFNELGSNRLPLNPAVNDEITFSLSE